MVCLALKTRNSSFEATVVTHHFENEIRENKCIHKTNYNVMCAWVAFYCVVKLFNNHPFFKLVSPALGQVPVKPPWVNNSKSTNDIGNKIPYGPRRTTGKLANSFSLILHLISVQFNLHLHENDMTSLARRTPKFVVNPWRVWTKASRGSTEWANLITAKQCRKGCAYFSVYSVIRLTN